MTDPGPDALWTYESIADAIPGVDLPDWLALAVQFALFEGVVLALAVVYDLWSAVPAGTVAIVVATAGSALMLTLGRRFRRLSPPPVYRQLLFGSSIEVVLGVFAFVALVTYLFVYDPRQARTPLLVALLGPRPPVPAVFVTLLVLWDVCYRIGTAWWASVVGFLVGIRYPDDPAGDAFRRIDLLVVAFAALQLVLVPFVWGYWLLVVALLGHVAAVLLVSGTTIFVRTRGGTF